MSETMNGATCMKIKDQSRSRTIDIWPRGGRGAIELLMKLQCLTMIN